MDIFNYRKSLVLDEYEKLVTRKNTPIEGNGIYNRYQHPVLTAAMVPPFWKYDFNPATNPFFMERIGCNAVLNSGAIKLDGKYLLVVRVEGADRKSFFAVAESPNGVDNFRFWNHPVTMPEDTVPGTNVYDMRLTQHEDGWIYGLFCVERHDDSQPGDLSAATATCGIARTKNLVDWERLPDLKTKSQQLIIDERLYHTIKEVKNGEGPHPIKTPQGWLHLAHGVRNCASGLRYVLYLYMTSLEEPWKRIASPGGYFMAPVGDEYMGDVMNVLFSNGWIADEDGRVFIYYASSDTRMHVATSTVEQLVDYCLNTPSDGLTTGESVKTLNKLIDKNLAFGVE